MIGHETSKFQQENSWANRYCTFSDCDYSINTSKTLYWDRHIVEHIIQCFMEHHSTEWSFSKFLWSWFNRHHFEKDRVGWMNELKSAAATTLCTYSRRWDLYWRIEVLCGLDWNVWDVLQPKRPGRSGMGGGPATLGRLERERSQNWQICCWKHSC